MTEIELEKSVVVAGEIITSITIRAPGRKVVERMAANRVAGGFTDRAVIDLTARLCGHTESTIRRLSVGDIAKARQTLETLFMRERRRLRARGAIVANEKEGG